MFWFWPLNIKQCKNIVTYVAATTSISGINADNTVIQVTPVVFAFLLRQNTSVINISQNFTDSTGRVWGSAPSTDLKEKYEREIKVYHLTQLSESLFCSPIYQIIVNTWQYHFYRTNPPNMYCLHGPLNRCGLGAMWTPDSLWSVCPPVEWGTKGLPYGQDWYLENTSTLQGKLK